MFCTSRLSSRMRLALLEHGGAGTACLPIGGTDASVIALAERLDTDLIVTLDYRHFRAVRPYHCLAFWLLPDVF